MSDLFYVLEMMSQDVDFKVQLNDISVVQVIDQPPKTLQQKINQYLVSGKNTIVINAKKNKNHLNPEFNLSVLSGKYGTELGKENLIYKYEMELNDIVLSEHYTEIFSHEFVILESLPKKFWESADRLNKSDFREETLKDFVKNLYFLFEKKNVSKLMKVFNVKHKELSTSLGVDIQKITMGVESHLTMLFSDVSWSLKKINFDDLLFDFSDGGQVVSIKTSTGAPPIEGGTQKLPYILDLNVVLVDGKWVIIP